MNCCGRQHALPQPPFQRTAQSEPVWMSYAGVKVIVVKGAATGHVYRFSPGNWLRVQGGDAASMRGIPGLAEHGLAAPVAGGKPE